MPSFSAQVSDWVGETLQRKEAVAKASVQDLAEEVVRPRSRGGRMRVDTGFLRASLLASTSAAPRISPTSRPQTGRTYPENLTQVVGTIVGWDTEHPIWLGFTASYASFREFGANGQSGDSFVTSAALMWQELVNRNAAELISRNL